MDSEGLFLSYPSYYLVSNVGYLFIRKAEPAPLDTAMKRADIKAAFPDLPEEEGRALSRETHGRLLTQAEQKDYLRYWSLSYAMPDICRQMDVATCAVNSIIQCVSDFGKAVQRPQHRPVPVPSSTRRHPNKRR
jgi:hypothetical protein